jgi:hypothetical protein
MLVPSDILAGVMDEQSLAEMLRRDQKEWTALVHVLDSHPGGPVHDPESPAWEARHVYAHVARWLNHSMDDFQAVLAGRPRSAPPEGDDNTVNARWKDADDTISLTDARDRAQAAYERRLRLIESVPPGAWTPLLDAIAKADGYQHYIGHRRGIESAHPHEQLRQSQQEGSTS